MYPLERVFDWCEQHKGHMIQINKHEDQDLDVLMMNLNKITFASLDPYHHDSYLTEQALYLHGTGVYQTHSSLVQAQTPDSPLPDDIYVIPLEGAFTCDIQPDQVHIHTARAVYTIKPLS